MKKKLLIKGHDKNPFVKFWNFCWNIYYKNPEVWNYLIAGGITTITCIGTKFLFLKTFLDQTNGLELQIAEILSWIIAVIVAYLLNKFFVFKTKSINFIKEFISFMLARVGTQVLQMLIMFVFVTLLSLNTDLWILIITLLCQIMQIVVNYILSKLFIFKKA